MPYFNKLALSGYFNSRKRKIGRIFNNAAYLTRDQITRSIMKGNLIRKPQQSSQQNLIYACRQHLAMQKILDTEVQMQLRITSTKSFILPIGRFK